MPRITLRTALPFLAGGLFSLLGPLPVKEASASYLVIPSPEVAEASAAYKYANMTEAEALAELDKRKVPYKRADPISGVTTPVRLTGKLHGVYIHSSIPESQRATSMYEVLDARLALALDDFAKILERHDIEEVVHYSLYRPNVPRQGHGLSDGLHAGHGHDGDGGAKVVSAAAKAEGKAGAAGDGKVGTGAAGATGVSGAASAAGAKPGAAGAASASASASAAGAKPGAAGTGGPEAVGKTSAGAKPGAAGKAGAAVPGVGAVAVKGSPGQKPASAGTPAPATKPGAGKAGAALPKLPAAGKALPSPGAKGSGAPAGAKQKTPASGATEKPVAGSAAQAGVKRADRGQAAAPKAGAKGAGAGSTGAAAAAPVSKAGAGGAAAAVSGSKGAAGGAAASGSKGAAGGAAGSGSKAAAGGDAVSGSKAAPGAKSGAVTAAAVAGAGAKGGVTTAAVAETKAGAVTTAVTKPVTRQTWAPPGTRHPAGLAIDVAMLKKRDGQWISVARHFQGKIGAKTCGDGVRTADTPEARELRSIVCEANDLGVFTYVLTPNFNAAHFDHFHMEIKPTVKWFLYH